ncbi:MAG: hypothetical protein JWM56_440 [Candidatus Peribacteria bacterium]|nr:hypothetical protein [Candidatus Peribacteria bacterium]
MKRSLQYLFGKNVRMVVACLLVFAGFLPTQGSMSVLAANSASSSSLNEGPIDSCQRQVEDQASAVQAQHRSILFGQKPARDLPINSITYDESFLRWIKTGTDKWTGPGGRAATNAEMDKRSPFAGRRGIFETRGVTTSELIPSLTQDARAFDCALAAVCVNAGLSAAQIQELTQKDGRIKIETRGCLPVMTQPLSACSALNTTGDRASIDIANTYCQPMVDSIVQHENDVLKMTVSYDAAYRSLLQFAGSFDGFLGQFKGDLLTPIEQTASLVSQLSRIPCFLAECNE